MHIAQASIAQIFALHFPSNDAIAKVVLHSLDLYFQLHKKVNFSRMVRTNAKIGDTAMAFIILKLVIEWREYKCYTTLI